MGRKCVFSGVLCLAAIGVAVNSVHAGDWTITQLTDNNYDDERPQIDGSNVVWHAQDNWHGDTGYNVFLYDGDNTTRLTTDNNYGSARYPQIDGANVVWYGQDTWDGGRDYEIFLYDGNTTTQLTNNSYYDTNPQIDGSNVTWSGHDGNDYEIFLYDGNSTIQLTNNSYDDRYPRIRESNVTWRSYDGNDYEIFFYDGNTTTQLTNNSYDDVYPRISGSNVVWNGWDGSDNEIFLYDGDSTTQLTDNSYDDLVPKTDGSNVVWYGWDGSDNEIFLYDGNSTTQLTNNSYNDTHPWIDDGANVVWSGGDGDADAEREIFVYDGDSTTQLTNNSYKEWYAKIDGSNMVWVTETGNGSEIFLATYQADVPAASSWINNPGIVGQWADSSNWSDGVPGAGSAAYIDNGGIVGISSNSTADNLYVGHSQTGAIRHEASAASISQNLYLGYNAGSSGSYELTGSGQLDTDVLAVGESGAGTFTQRGGTVANVATLRLAKQVGSEGTYNLQGGRLIVERIEQGAGSARFNWTGGELDASRVFLSSLTNEGGVLSSGIDGAIGNMKIEGNYIQTSMGAVEFDIAGYIMGGEYDVIAASGDIALDGFVMVHIPAASGFSPQLNDTFDVMVGNSLSGQYSLSAASLGGGLVFSSEIIGASVLRLTVVQGVALDQAGVEDPVYVPDQQTGPTGSQTVDTVNIGDQGQLDMPDTGELTANDGITIESGGTLDGGGGTVNADISNGGTIDGSGGTLIGDLNNSGTINSEDGTHIGDLTNSGTVNTAGGVHEGDILNESSGVLNCSGGVQTGAIINYGQMNSSGSGVFTGTIINYGTIQSTGGGTSYGGTLINYGSIVVSVDDDFIDLSNHGSMDLGNTPDDVLVDGNYEQSGVLIIDLAGYLQGDEYDFIEVGGSASLEGHVDVRLIGDFDPVFGSTFDILTAAEGITIGSGGLQLSGAGDFSMYLADGGNTLRLETVPEPTSLGLLLTGGLVLLRRRRM
ncbi:MAG: PEP-CTERM sorting domain-containing protein [Phycisphaerae bacterium]|jgi:hypothetical protein|nr:PEP-CTERM sorting domain-containing protein [Phycisphaerae bacterium]